MGPFAALERFFERLFERQTARLFRARLQPLQLQRRIERAIESGRLSSADRVFVPNRFVVRLNPADVDAFGELISDLEAELATAALTYARAHRYTVADRPDVRIHADNAVRPGDVGVQARFVDEAGVRDAGARNGRPFAPEEHPLASLRPSAHLGRADSAAAEATFPPAGPSDSAAVPGAELASRTMVFQVPRVDAPVAVLREFDPDGTQREITVDGRPMTLGRSMDNAIVLRDSRVSRHHGRLQGRQGALVYTDLGSTNGTRVNGIPVDEVVLGEGDRIEVGDTVLVVESLPEA